MTRLAWDKVGERFYEIGVDRGVLYLPSSPGVYDNGVAWNGLTSVEEDFGDDTTDPLYYDGIKYLDKYSFGDALFKLSAYTYPDEFPAFEGMHELGEGTYLDDQRPNVFAICFRTKIGSDLESPHYKIHILYNLTAISEGTTYETVSDTTAQPLLFSWTMASKPEYAEGYRPTGYVIFDTRFMSTEFLAIIEDILYGSDARVLHGGRIDGLFPTSPSTDILDGGTALESGAGLVDGNTYYLDPIDPRLPNLADLIAMAKNLRPHVIVPHISGIADLLAGEGDLSPTDEAGLFWALPTTRLIETDIPGLYDLTGG